MKSIAALLALSIFCASVAAQSTKPHHHGAVKLGVAIDGAEVTLAVEMPLDSVVGFERAPRTDAERKAAATALEKLRDGGSLFRFDAPAACTLAGVKVDAPVLEQAAKAGADKKEKEHADLDATYTFKCAQPSRLTSLEVLLFDAFKRIERIDVQAVLPHGQTKAVLRRTARQVRLAK